MSQTVVGFFDNQTEAHQAVRELQGKGISRDRIDVASGKQGADMTRNSSGDSDINPVSGSARDENSVRRTSDGRTVDRDDRNTNMFTDFFNNLFDSDDDDAGRFSHVAERSEVIVTVHAQSEEEAERVSEILDDAGAIDVDEKASQYGYSGVGGRHSSDSGSNRSAGSITSGNTRSEGNKSRSRIFNKRVDDNMRLRSFDGDEGV